MGGGGGGGGGLCGSGEDALGGVGTAVADANMPKPAACLVGALANATANGKS